jgi:ribosomal protein S18 acetylase RimI-like enzyme
MTGDGHGTRQPAEGRAAITVRPARREDASDLARLVDMAGEGLPRHVWASMAEPGEDVWSVGTRRAARDEGAFSWRNAAIAEIGGMVAGGLVTYRIGATPEPLDDLPPIFRPLQELENLAPGSHYINVLATQPEWRRCGVGRRLLEEAAARAAGAPELSLTVADANVAALALYRAFGFTERARRPILKDGWTCESSDWVLLTLPLAPAP